MRKASQLLIYIFYYSFFAITTEVGLGLLIAFALYQKLKGKQFFQEASILINNSFLKNNFIGYIEPDQITSGKADVIVTDGFTGNIALKTAEGLSKFIMNVIGAIFYLKEIVF